MSHRWILGKYSSINEISGEQSRTGTLCMSLNLKWINRYFDFPDKQIIAAITTLWTWNFQNITNISDHGAYLPSYY